MQIYAGENLDRMGGQMTNKIAIVLSVLALFVSLFAVTKKHRIGYRSEIVGSNSRSYLLKDVKREFEHALILNNGEIVDCDRIERNFAFIVMPGEIAPLPHYDCVNNVYEKMPYIIGEDK